MDVAGDSQFFNVLGRCYQVVLDIFDRSIEFAQGSSLRHIFWW